MLLYYNAATRVSLLTTFGKTKSFLTFLIPTRQNEVKRWKQFPHPHAQKKAMIEQSQPNFQSFCLY